MSSPPNAIGGFHPGLWNALLDYAREPGKFQVALRQPALLFASIPEILRLAAGRGSHPQAMPHAQREAIREAACFFTSTALLYPGADNHALLGLEHTASDADLKDRYRVMMRLVHPDFSDTSSGTCLPTDAAVRVILAYDVLSSGTGRPQKEATPTSSGRQSAGKIAHVGDQQPGRSVRHSPSRAASRRVVMVCSILGATTLLASLSMGGSDGAGLVQRSAVERVGAGSHKVTLAEAQPLISALMQQLESGHGDRVIDLLQNDARNHPAAQALSRQYDDMVDGIRPVRLTHVDFDIEPRTHKLLVTSHVRLQVGEPSLGSKTRTRTMVLHAEFAARDGAVIMTALSSSAGN